MFYMWKLKEFPFIKKNKIKYTTAAETEKKNTYT